VAFDTTVIYALGGLMTGLAGMMEASRPTTGSFPPQRIQVHHDHGILQEHPKLCSQAAK
jgi:hypothetical protein